MAARRTALLTPPDVLKDRMPIWFRHPGYPDDNLLIKFPRVEAAGTIPTEQYGIRHQVALLACQIIAGNAFTGYLVDEQHERVLVGLDGVLLGNTYYFVIDGQDNYAIIPSFQDWEYPHSYNSSLQWPGIQEGIDSNHCAITRYTSALEKAHLVPREEQAWFNQNGMRAYGGDTEPNNIDTPSNLISIRADLHTLFDQRWFVVFPCPEYRVYVIQQRASRIVNDIHDVPVCLSGVVAPFLFTRFAWAVLFAVKGFVTGQQSRKVRVRNTKTTPGEPKYITTIMSGEELQIRYGGGGSKAATPISKRSRSLADDRSVNSDDEEDPLLWPGGIMEEWSARSRRAIAGSSETTAPLPGKDESELYKSLSAVLGETKMGMDKE
ncbi:hypothetical protein GQ53DRAFT_177621 [Thozetella sp. PMI_491]|nr:hypothetical protein GQ53DRAFT_177621 [Thozetella sp. PMI_491]